MRPGENVYPITATVFVLMAKQPKNPEGAMRALDFFKWALESGQPQAQTLDYVTLPPSLVQRIFRITGKPSFRAGKGDEWRDLLQSGRQIGAHKCRHRSTTTKRSTCWARLPK